jgi:thiamine-phosphate pyrophosphorylase
VTKIQFYFFTNVLNEIISNNIIKFKNACIIYKPEKHISKNYIEILKIRNFCKKNKIKFYFSDDYKLANKFAANGIFLSSINKSFIRPIQLQNDFNIVGSAHNTFEYWVKNRQNCKEIMLSPVFFNKKYSSNKILGITRFNLMSTNWSLKLCALGGINLGNLRKLKMSKASSIAFISLMNSSKIKKPIYFFSRWA